MLNDLLIHSALRSSGFKHTSVDSGKRMLFELAIRANAGGFGSYQEELFLKNFHFLRQDRTLNKQGREYLEQYLAAETI